MTEGVNRRLFLRGSAAGAGAGVAALALPTGPASADPGSDADRSGALRIGRTTVEHAETLLGTDVVRPRLSWVLDADGHHARQSAYQVVVAVDPRALEAGRDLLWDSGRVESDRTVDVVYAGPEPRPRTRYHWRVRVWDGPGRPSAWSATRWWETALLGTPWRARWIGTAAPEAPPTPAGASWIWSSDATPSNAPVGPRWFRGVLPLPPDGVVRRAVVVGTADDDFTLHLNGEHVLDSPVRVDGWRTGRAADVTERVRAAGARVVLAAVATNRGGVAVNPAGLLLRLVVDLADGRSREFVTGPGWRVSGTERAGWREPDHDDGDWAAPVVLAPHGQGPWGGGVSVPVPERPAPLLRREFTVDRPIARARLRISGLAYYEAEINGTRVGAQVLDPGFTDYDETVLHATHDVTPLLSRGANAIGVTLGRGFYGMTTPNVWNWHLASWHGEPRLLAELEIDHPDGTSTVVASDADWRLTDGPTLSNSLYAGETHDARRERPGWSTAGFDDTGWEAPVLVEAPGGAVRAQQHDPITVAETVRPREIAEPAPGVFVVDLGRTVAGWTRITVRAAEGTAVSLLHGERLDGDGRVLAVTDLVHGGRFQRDEYVCRGGGDETWEARFSYKGFRYVEITGLPAAPVEVVGRVVHTSVPETGSFRCSEPFFETLDAAMRRTLLNNLHGIPTDTPMYEKNGWTGDAQLGAPVMARAFGMQRFLAKWIDDLADAQTAAGQLPVIVPSGSWGYTEAAPSPEWTTVYPFLVSLLHRVYGDERVAAEHWGTLTRYLDWEIGRLRNGLAETALGDYLPPGYGGNPPEDTRLTATAYLHRALLATAELGDVLGHGDVSARYREVADGLRDALNAEFLDPSGHYRTSRDPDYRQTSNAVPLAFGLVPPGARAAVVASLVADVRARGNHLNTGALGTSVLLPVLSANGHADVAHALATQRTEPSWGHWFDNGADTMWEMWHVDSRSRDHYFQGTVVQWLHENVAGLRPGGEGYRTFVVRPDARVGVTWAQTSLETVRGRAAAGWSLLDRVLRLTVDVPVGSTAEVHVPAARREDVGSTPRAEFVRTEPGFVVLRAGHGRWQFTSRTPS
jgi:alpha-L-rhamnosidase